MASCSQDQLAHRVVARSDSQMLLYSRAPLLKPRDCLTATDVPRPRSQKTHRPPLVIAHVWLPLANRQWTGRIVGSRVCPLLLLLPRFCPTLQPGVNTCSCSRWGRPRCPKQAVAIVRLRRRRRLVFTFAPWLCRWPWAFEPGECQTVGAQCWRAFGGIRSSCAAFESRALSGRRLSRCVCVCLRCHSRGVRLAVGPMDPWTV